VSWFRRDAPPPDLSVTVVAWNREQELAGLIENVAGFAREIVVVDGGSADGTEALCREHPLVRYVQRPWDGHFAKMKNASFAHARGEWILHLDTDERVSPGLAAGLPALCAGRAAFLRLPMLWLVDDEHYLKTEKHYPCHVPRLFRNVEEHRYQEHVGPVHPRFPKAIRRQMKKVREQERHLLHYALAWASRDELRAKAQDYARREPGSEDTNRAYYLWWEQEHEFVALPEDPR
jgi:glycosyltransferase involved in cell wall biosynthesis